jgi:hypothetical protein
MPGKRPADTYLRLYKVAERSPLKALGLWLSTAAPDQSRSPTVLATHQRGLRRLKALARGAVADAKAAELEDLIKQAESRLARVAVLVPRGPTEESDLTLTLAPPEKVSVMAATSTPRERACPPDLARLQEIAAKWPSETWVRWLADGFRTVEDGSGPAHLAFPPIRLYPVGRYLEQFEATIAEAGECRLGVAVGLQKSIAAYLTTGFPALPDGPRFDPIFWRLYAQSRPTDYSGAVPFGYLEWFSQSPNVRVNESELVDAICQAVFDTVPGSTTVASLFECLADQFDSASADAALIVALLNEAQKDLGLSNEPVPDAAEKCRGLVARRQAGIGPALDRLLARGRLDRQGVQAFGVAIHTAPQLLDAIGREAARRVLRPEDILSQPPPIPLRETLILELA